MNQNPKYRIWMKNDIKIAVFVLLRVPYESIFDKLKKKTDGD